MHFSTFLQLLGASFLALLALPLFIMLFPAGLGCCIASLLLVALAIPDLPTLEKRDTSGERTA